MPRLIRMLEVTPMRGVNTDGDSPSADLLVSAGFERRKIGVESPPCNVALWMVGMLAGLLLSSNLKVLSCAGFCMRLRTASRRFRWW